MRYTLHTDKRVYYNRYFQEVQNFQEFMANSKNRYGGWIAYNHIIFEQTWCKYFNYENVEDYVSERHYLKNFEPFVEELLLKIHDKYLFVRYASINL